MTRLEDGIGLFCMGVGSSTESEIKCDICNTTHNEGENGEYSGDGESIEYDTFAGLTVCHCCYNKVERSVVNRMEWIMPWYRRALERHAKELRARNNDLREVEEVDKAIDEILSKKLPPDEAPKRIRTKEVGLDP